MRTQIPLSLADPIDLDRRAAFRAAYANGALWGIGNGLASTSLLIYLVTSLGARGLMVAFILATPRLVGLLRLTTPVLIERLGDRRRFCLATYGASALVLLTLPLMLIPVTIRQGESSGLLILLIVLIWSLYHLLEYLGTVSLWSWLGDLAPGRIRGRFVGRRERWLTLGVAVGVLVTGIAELWRRSLPDEQLESTRLVLYISLLTAGAGMMLAALAPLAWMPSLPLRTMGRVGNLLGTLTAPLRDPRYWRLLAFGCWFSFFNGVTQAPQSLFPIVVLKLPLFWMVSLPLGMRLGQSAVSAPVGRWVDSLGNRPVMIVSQLIVALGPLFYLAAAQRGWWWIFGAWAAWIAYAGLNVALPSLMLKLSPGNDSSAYVATYFAITGVAYGLSTILGGWLFDLSGRLPETWMIGTWQMDRYQLFFLVGWLTRSAGVIWLFWIIEPGARKWSEILWPRPASIKAVTGEA